MILELIFQIGQLTVYRRVVKAVGPAPALQPSIPAAGPLAEAVAPAAGIPGMWIEGRLAADVGHDPAGRRLAVLEFVCQIIKYIIGILSPGGCTDRDSACTACHNGSRKCAAHQHSRDPSGRLCFPADLTIAVLQIESLLSQRAEGHFPPTLLSHILRL